MNYIASVFELLFFKDDRDISEYNYAGLSSQLE